MYLSLTSFCLGVSLFTSANAFDVEFWGESNCAGTPLGTFSGGVSEGCQQLFIGEAEGVPVTRASASDDGTVVAFYSSSNCDLGTAVAEGDNGCIAIDSFSSQYMSFSVIQSAGQGPVKRSVLNTTADNPYGYEHGKLASYANVTYKWHQVASNGWKGIHPDEWDDHVHVKNYKTINTTSSISSTTGRGHVPDVAVREPSHLDEPSFLWATCTVVANCALAVVDGTSYAVGTVAATFVTAVTLAILITSQQVAKTLL